MVNVPATVVPGPPAIESLPKRVYVLTAADRCDKTGCGARAWHRITWDNTGFHLDFCHHHGKEVREGPLPVNVTWLDESDAINPPKEFYN